MNIKKLNESLINIGKVLAENKVPFWEPEWTKLKGQDILQIKGSKYAALPASGKKNASRFVIFNTRTREEITQVKKSEVSNWLIRKAKDEKVKPTGHI